MPAAASPAEAEAGLQEGWLAPPVELGDLPTSARLPPRSATHWLPRHRRQVPRHRVARHHHQWTPTRRRSNVCLTLRMMAGIYKGLPYDEYVLVDNTTPTAPAIVWEDDFRANTAALHRPSNAMPPTRGRTRTGNPPKPAWQRRGSPASTRTRSEWQPRRSTGFCWSGTPTRRGCSMTPLHQRREHQHRFRPARRRDVRVGDQA